MGILRSGHNWSAGHGNPRVPAPRPAKQKKNPPTSLPTRHLGAGTILASGQKVRGADLRSTQRQLELRSCGRRLLTTTCRQKFNPRQPLTASSPDHTYCPTYWTATTMASMFEQPRNGTLFLGGQKISGSDIRDQNGTTQPPLAWSVGWRSMMFHANLSASSRYPGNRKCRQELLRP
jgi:hypothetical protein